MTNIVATVAHTAREPEQRPLTARVAMFASAVLSLSNSVTGGLMNYGLSVRRLRDHDTVSGLEEGLSQPVRLHGRGWDPERVDIHRSKHCLHKALHCGHSRKACATSEAFDLEADKERPVVVRGRCHHRMGVGRRGGDQDQTQGAWDN